MAVKAIVEVRRLRVAADERWMFYLNIHETVAPCRFVEEAELITTLLATTTTVAQIQAAIATFAKAWTTENWGTQWTPGTDSLRILNPSVTNVNA